MKKVRRIIAVILALTLLLFSVSFAAFAEDSAEENLLTVMSYNVSARRLWAHLGSDYLAPLKRPHSANC